MSVLQKIRPIIFGMEDGLVSIWGLVVGVAVGSSSSNAVILAGLAGAVSAALSMAAGEYISSKSKREVQDAHIQVIRKKVKTNKKAVLNRLKKHWTKDEGLTNAEASTMAKIYGKSNERLIHHVFETDGFIESTLEKPTSNAALMFGSFVLAAMFPIGPFFFYPLAQAETFSFVLTGAALFTVGALKTEYTDKPWYKSGLEMLIIGAIAGLGGYIVGNYFA